MNIAKLILRELEDQFVPMLQDCVKIAELKKIHANILKHSLSQSNFLTTKMIDLCDAHGEIVYAQLLFNQIIEPNIFLYNAILRTYTHNHFYSQSISIYKQMLRHRQAKSNAFPDKFTYPFVIKACAGLLFLGLGRQIHGHVCKSAPIYNIVIGNSLIDMYTKCNLVDALKVFEQMSQKDVVSWNTIISGHARLGQMKKARKTFELMSEKTIVSWTAMISGYTRIGCYTDALEVFQQMQLLGLKPDEISLVSVLPACAQLGALELGKWIHIYSDKNGLLRNNCICNALIEMYSKCGSIDQALQLFDTLENKDVISWSTIIGGLANHGRAREAIQVFSEMERAQVEPNGITFLGLLSACAHAGLLDEGLRYFESMEKVYSIDPGVEHYGCIVDLLGRSGFLNQALGYIKKMPFNPDASVWGSLLSSCRTHGNLEIAKIAMEHLLELEPDDAGNYVLLSNIYADLGKWDEVSRMRKLMKNNRMKKTPGCSSIEVNNEVQEFSSGDDSNPLWNEMYEILKLLGRRQSALATITDVILEDIVEMEF